MTDEQKGYCSVTFKILKKSNKTLHINGIGNQYSTGKWFEMSNEDTWTEELPWNHNKVETALNTLCKLGYLSTPQKGLYELAERGYAYNSFEEGEIDKRQTKERQIKLEKNQLKLTDAQIERVKKILKDYPEVKRLQNESRSDAQWSKIWAGVAAIAAFVTMLIALFS